MSDKSSTILIKLSRSGKDFYEEHKKVIEKNGVVDFARLGRRIRRLPSEKGSKIYLKESKFDGGRLIVGTIEEIRDEGEFYPDYYKDLNLQMATWIRLNDMKVISKDVFLDSFELRSGGPIKGYDTGMASVMYISEK